MKTLHDALEQRERIFGAFEMAELEEDPEARKPWLTFVVVGGGPTGVEISGQIAELARRALKDNFRRFDPASVRVILFDGGKEILATFGDKLSEKGPQGARAHRGRDPHQSIVTHVDADGVEVKGSDGSVDALRGENEDLGRPASTASPLAKMLADATGAECDRRGPRSRCSRTARCPATRRCSQSAT